MVLVEITSLLEKEEITPWLGGSTDMLVIYGQPFSIRKMVGWAVTFQFGKWPKISDGHAFSSSKYGPDRTVIFVMKMV
jgi:hypothetical protein